MKTRKFSFKLLNYRYHFALEGHYFCYAIWKLRPKQFIKAGVLEPNLIENY